MQSLASQTDSEAAQVRLENCLEEWVHLTKAREAAVLEAIEAVRSLVSLALRTLSLASPELDQPCSL